MRLNKIGITRDLLIVFVSVAMSSAITYRMTQPSARIRDILRAGRFELVDGRGRVAAALETTDTPKLGQATALRFMDRSGKTQIEIGVRFDAEYPYLVLSGKDKRPRISIAVDSYGNPALNMSDHQWDGRLLLGTLPGDLPVLGPLKEWGLFLNPSRQDNKAAVWVSGEWYSGDERAGVAAHSADKRRQR